VNSSDKVPNSELVGILQKSHRVSIPHFISVMTYHQTCIFRFHLCLEKEMSMDSRCVSSSL